MGFPTSNVHRPSRRKLGRGQNPQHPLIATTVAKTGNTTATITCSEPVVVSGNIPMTVGNLTLVSQAVPSPTQITQVYSGNITGDAYTLNPLAANVTGSLGQGVAGAAGTF